MVDSSLDKLKFPIGKLNLEEALQRETLPSLIHVIEEAPDNYRKLTGQLSPSELAKVYRPGSWNIQQLVNHVADIQLLHYFRMKKAITEPGYKDVTLIDIDRWAFTDDGLYSPIQDSLLMLEGITKRYVYLMRSLNENQHNISYYHPVRQITITQKQAIAMSAWHVRHHMEHIKIALGNV